MCEVPLLVSSQEKAIRVPSGENVGPHSAPGKPAKGTRPSEGGGGSSLDGTKEAADNGSAGRFEYNQIPPPITSASRVTTAAGQIHCLQGSGGPGGDDLVTVLLIGLTRPESRSRLSRFRSARNSAAV